MTILFDAYPRASTLPNPCLDIQKWCFFPELSIALCAPCSKAITNTITVSTISISSTSPVFHQVFLVVPLTHRCHFGERTERIRRAQILEGPSPGGYSDLQCCGPRRFVTGDYDARGCGYSSVSSTIWCVPRLFLIIHVDHS